jgi:hypothetical protein
MSYSKNTDELQEKSKPVHSPETAHKAVADRLLNRRLSGILPQNYPLQPSRINIPEHTNVVRSVSIISPLLSSRLGFVKKRYEIHYFRNPIFHLLK